MLKRVVSAALLLFSVIVPAIGVASAIEVSDSAFYYEQGKVTDIKGSKVYVDINTARLKTLPKKHLVVEIVDDAGNVSGSIGQIVMNEGALSGTMFLKSGATVSEGMHVRAKLPGFSPTATSSSASSNDTCSTMPDGQAECTTKTGAQYNGKLKNGKPHGKGTMTMNNGNRYEGEFKDGFMEGDGKYIFKDGGYYEGEFKKNKFAGSGEQVFSSGARYKGDFKEDTRHGSGKYTFKDGGYYEGAFVDGKRTGQGILKMANGNEYEGEFKDGKFHGKGKLTFKAGGYWEGTFVDGKLNGKGLKVYADGGRYEGDLVDDKRNGYGMLKMPNGNEYDGQFKDDKSHGRGVYKWANGDRYEGDYVDGKRTRGIFTWGSDSKWAGDKYVGDFADGKRTGYGTYTYKNGKVAKGYFIENKFMPNYTQADWYDYKVKNDPDFAGKEAARKYRDAFKAAATSSDFRSFISTYESNDPDKLIPTARERLKAAELQEYRDSYTNARTSADSEKFISDYQANDPDRLIPGAKKKLAEAKKREAAEAKAEEKRAAEAKKREAAEAKAKALQQYRESFKNARSSDDFDTFIKTYTGKDPDKLIPKARQMKAAAEKRERQERAESERRQAKACDHLYRGKKVRTPKISVGMGWEFNYDAIVLGTGNGRVTVEITESGSQYGKTFEFNCSYF